MRTQPTRRKLNLERAARSLHKKLREFRDGKDRHAAVGAGGDKLQLAGFEMASVDRHSCGIPDGEARRLSRRGIVCAAGADLKRKICASRPKSDNVGS
jgi:hypothetical protein